MNEQLLGCGPELPLQGARRLYEAGDSEQPTEPPWPALRDCFLNQEIIPFLGAGASAYSSAQSGGAPPSGHDLINRLAHQASLRIDCGVTGCRQSRFDLARIASYYQTCVTSRRGLDSLLKQAIADPTFNPNPLHHLLARIARQKPMLIITTNYDDLLEQAFEQPNDGGAAVPFEVVVTPADDLAYPDEEDSEPGPEQAGGVLHWVSGTGQPDFSSVLGSELIFDLSKRSVIYKIHGSVPRGSSWPGAYLIAEEDYARFLGRMDKKGIVPEAIMSLIAKKQKIARRKVPVYSLLFLGYGMHDWNLRVLLEELHIGRRAPGEETHYAFVRRPDPVDKNILQNRRVQVYDCDLSQFVQRISELL